MTRCPSCGSDHTRMRWCSVAEHGRVVHAYVHHECVRCLDFWHNDKPTYEELESQVRELTAQRDQLLEVGSKSRREIIRKYVEYRRVAVSSHCCLGRIESLESERDNAKFELQGAYAVVAELRAKLEAK